MMSDKKKPISAAQPSQSSTASDVTTPQTATGEAAPAREEQVQAPRRAHPGGDTRVLIHNDEVTPYDYVINTLGDIFFLSEEISEHVAWTAHTRGTAVVVVRPRPEAEKLVKAAHSRAKVNGYPLTFTLEAE